VLPVQDFKELQVWQKSMALTKAIYQTIQSFPKFELWALARQMCRAASSIPCNIAEGQGRGTRADYRHFVINARGSSAELETQLIIARKVGYLTEQTFSNLIEQTHGIRRMLNGLIRSLSE